MSATPSRTLAHGLRRGGSVVVATLRRIDVGKGQVHDPLGLPGGDTEQPEQILGDLIRGLAVVAFGVVVEELAEAEGGTRSDRECELGVAGGEPPGPNACRLALSVPAEVVVPIYPLAPQVTTSVTVPAMTELLADLVENVGPEHVTLMG